VPPREIVCFTVFKSSSRRRTYLSHR
jgi:hypothetical protein